MRQPGRHLPCGEAESGVLSTCGVNCAGFPGDPVCPPAPACHYYRSYRACRVFPAMPAVLIFPIAVVSVGLAEAGDPARHLAGHFGDLAAPFVLPYRASHFYSGASTGRQDVRNGCVRWVLHTTDGARDAQVAGAGGLIGGMVLRLSASGQNVPVPGAHPRGCFRARLLAQHGCRALGRFFVRIVLRRPFLPVCRRGL